MQEEGGGWKGVGYLKSSGRGSRKHLQGGSGFEWEEFGTIEGLMGFEHGVKGMQEFAHDSDQGLHFMFALGEQVMIEGAQVGLVLDGDQRGHEQGVAQVGIAGLADARPFVHGGSRVVLARIESGISPPLTRRQVGSEHG